MANENPYIFTVPVGLLFVGLGLLLLVKPRTVAKVYARGWVRYDDANVPRHNVIALRIGGVGFIIVGILACFMPAMAY